MGEWGEIRKYNKKCYILNMAEILYGAPVREEIKKGIIERIKKMGRRPFLAIVQVGDREDSNVYIKQKQKFGEEIGVKVRLIKMERWKDGKIGEEKIIKEIKKLNKDENIDGIIMQLPLPEGFDSEKILNTIDNKKDADGLVSRGTLDTVPATARGVMALLDFYEIPVTGKNAAVIGRSRLAGAPIAEVLKNRGAKVSVCNRSTLNTAQICRETDILISAAGKAGLVTRDFVKKGQTVVDVGINRTEEGKLVGDVASNEVEAIVAAISPVPGGIGPLTVACLFQNLIDLCEKQVL